MDQRMDGCGRESRNHQELEEEEFFSGAIRGRMALLTPGFWASRLQICERVTVVLSHQVCCTLLWEP